MLSMLGLIDVLAGVIALIAINFGILRTPAYLLLVFIMLKGLWSIFAAMQ